MRLRALFIVVAGLGCTNTVLSFSGAQPLRGLSYATNSATYFRNVPIAENSPQLTGTASAYAITPPLPIGLGFNTQTGTISGAAIALSPAATYHVTATNAAG